MTIGEIEQRSGLERSNIRYYEREGLLSPMRRKKGYRDYSETDIALLQKIKLLRRLGFSLDTIRALQSGNTTLDEALTQRLVSIGTQRRELDATQQVCQKMQQDGASFFTLDADRYLRSYDRKLTPSLSDGIAPSVPGRDRDVPVRCPWRRFFARTLDLVLVRLLILSLLTLLGRVNVSRIPEIIDLFLVFVNWGLLMAAESFCLSWFGTTPGKWIMGIRLEHTEGRPLSPHEAVCRTWQVFAQGAGYTIPFYGLYCHWKAYNAVMDGSGPQWDKDVVLIVRKCGWRRCAAYVSVLITGMALGVTAAITPAMPMHRGEMLTVEQFVENYNQLARFHGFTTHSLLPDGTFQQQDGLHGAYVIRLNDPVVLCFTEDNGVLTEVSFEHEVFVPFYGVFFDPVGQETILLLTMAYAWTDVSFMDAFASADLLDSLLEHEEGLWEQDLLGCQISCSITPRKKTAQQGETVSEENYIVSFSITRPLKDSI